MINLYIRRFGDYIVHDIEISRDPSSPSFGPAPVRPLGDECYWRASTRSFQPGIGSLLKWLDASATDDRTRLNSG